MAVTLRLSHLIHCDRETFWRSTLDDALSEQICLHDLGFHTYRTLERSDAEGVVRRRVELGPRVEMPAAVKAVLGTAFRYVEDGVFEGDCYRFSLQAPKGFESERASASGVMRAQPAPEGGTRRLVELTIDIRVFGLRGLLESFATKAAEQSYAAHAAALNARLTR